MADLVTVVSNTIPTETAAAYKEARMVSKVVEGSATKLKYIDGIGFLKGKGNTMTAFPKAVEKL